MMNDQKIDINQAGIETLMTLPGIAEKLAVRIITYRETVHPFEELIELAAVPGISERMVRTIEDRVTLEALPETEAGELEDVANGGEEEDVTAVSPPNPPPEEAPLIILSLDEEPAIEAERALIPLAASPEPQPAATTHNDRDTTVKAHIYSSIAGAILGSALTLLFLLVMNGTLRFAGNGRFNQRQTQFQENLDVINQTQDDMNGEIDSMSGNLDSLTEQSAGLTTIQETAEGQLTAVQDNITTLQTNMTTLEADTAELEQATTNLDDRLSIAVKSAESFDLFLNSLRDMLIDLQGLPVTKIPKATPSTTPRKTATPGATTEPTRTPRATATPLVQSSPTVEETAVPTRTPRPTSTPGA